MQKILKVTLVMPCHNEEDSIIPMLESITRVMSELPPKTKLKALFIDDHSTDETRKRLSDAYSTFGVKKIGRSEFTFEVILLNHNYGKAHAQALGLNHSIKSSDLVILMDSDGQHDPNDLPKIIKNLIAIPKSTVGTRVGYRRKISNQLLMKTFSLLNKMMGVKFKPEWSEYVGLVKERAEYLTGLPQLGIVPISTLIMMIYPDTTTFTTTIKPRFDGKSSTRWTIKSLGRKALMHLFCDPWAFYPRLLVTSLLPMAFCLFYGFYMGVDAIKSGNLTGATSLALIVLLVGVIQILILNILMGVMFVFQKSVLNSGVYSLKDR
jgi:glucosyltransferase